MATYNTKEGPDYQARKTIPIKQIKSWSFSRYRDYVACPLKCKLKNLERIQEPPNDAMARGTDIHKKAELFLLGDLKSLPAELENLSSIFYKARSLAQKKMNMPMIEGELAFKQDWSQTHWMDWTGCWLRVKVDFAVRPEPSVVNLLDWKTGRYRAEKNEEYVEANELYALALLKNDPSITAVYTALGYVDEGMTYPERVHRPYTRADEKPLEKLWLKRVTPMMNDTSFIPRPSNECRWCWYGQAKKAAGGPGICKY